MSYTLTPNYSLYKPTINSDNDAWGGHINSNTDTLDTQLKAVSNSAAPAATNVGRNLIHNPMMNIAQRGAGPFTTAFAYTLDRWIINAALDTFSFQQNPMSDAIRAQIGDEAALFFFTNIFTGNAGAGATNSLTQYIENVHRLSGKTVTVSFYAAAGTAGLKLGCSVDQGFGTGGSPSSSVLGNGQSVTLSTTWTRYSLTFTLPSASGKTLGTNGNDSTSLNFWYSAGASYATRSGTVGVQSGTVALWGVQLEVGSVATPLEKIDPQQDLANCQRFYSTVSIVSSGYAQSIAALVGASAMPQVYMRGTPAIALITSSSANMGALTYAVFGACIQVYGYPAVAGGGYTIAVTLALSADL